MSHPTEPENEKWWILEKSTTGRATSTETYAGPFDDYVEAMNRCPDDAPGVEYSVSHEPVEETGIAPGE